MTSAVLGEDQFASRWQPIARRALFALWLLSMPFLCVIYAKVETNPDQMQFDYMGWLATQGYVYYRDIFDFNFLGAPITHELSIRLFGPNAWSWRMGDFWLMQLTAISTFVFLRRAGFSWAPVLFLVLYPPLYITAGIWMAGQRDIVALGFLLMAATAMLAPTRRELAALFAAGVLIAFAFLFRPTYLAFLGGLILLECLPRHWFNQPRAAHVTHRIAALVGGFLFVTLGLLLWALLGGFINDLFDLTVVYTAHVYAGEQTNDLVEILIDIFTRWWHWLTACALIGLALWGLRDRGLPYSLVLIIGMAATILLSYVVQGKGFGYHLSGFVPLLVVLTAVAIDQLFQRAQQARGTRLGAGLFAATITMVALATAGTAAKLDDYVPLLADVPANGLAPIVGNFDVPAAEQVELLSIIRDSSTAEDRMVQYGIAYQIPYLAQRLPAHRFLLPAVDFMKPDFPLYAPWMEEFHADMQRHKPKFIMITGPVIAETSAGWVANDTSLPTLVATLDYVNADYSVRMTGAFGVLFERRD